MDRMPDHMFVTLGRLLSHQRSLDSVPESLWPSIILTAAEQNVGPLLLYVIKQDGYSERLSPYLDPLVQRARAAGVRYIYLHATQQSVSTALAKAGIPAIWMKGIALAQTLYPQPVLRPMSDLDVLVPLDRAVAAVQALKAIGYRDEELDLLSQQIRQHIPVEQDLHHYSLQGGPGHTIHIEVHFDFYRHLLPQPTDLAWFWSHTTPAVAPDGTELGFTTLSHEAHLLYLCAHIMLQHGEEHMSLSHYYDLHLLANHQNMDWGQIVEQAVVLRWTYAVERALTLAREYFQSPIPADSLRALRVYRPADEDITLPTAISHGDVRWIQTLRSFGGLTAAQRWTKLRGLILPPRNYMRTRYGVPPGKLVLPYYPYRWLDLFRGAARGVYQTLRQR